MYLLLIKKLHCVMCLISNSPSLYASVFIQPGKGLVDQFCTMTTMVNVSLITAIATTFSLIVFPASSGAARILCVFPVISKSHLIVHSAVADTLAQAGHDVTVISTLPNVKKDAKYNYIQINVSSMDPAILSEIVNKPQQFYRGYVEKITYYSGFANNFQSTSEMQQFLRDHGEGSFDLLILGYVMNDFQVGLGAHFKCPIIVSFVIRSIFPLNTMIGNPEEISYVPTIASSLNQPMRFCDRVRNFLITTFEQAVMQLILNRLNEKNYVQHFPSDRYPPFDVAKNNVSLVLTNHHGYSQGPIRPTVPALIEIGGIQIKEQPEPLPTDIGQILENEENGVIYFSLGSIVHGSILSREKANIIFKVLSKLPYKVLWKWSDLEFPGTSANIVYKSWLPQDDILAHPNTRLFITHGGQGSVVESQYHGVPMVGIPLFSDQPGNMINVERSGYGLSVDYITMTEESLREAILEVLENRKYAEAVKRFSDLYRDRPMTARQTLKYWVEYVLRHNGARHLQSPAIYMNRWQLMSMDVIGFLLVLLALVVAAFVTLCKFLCCRGKKARMVTKTKKNK